MYATTYKTFTGSIGFFFVIAVTIAVLELLLSDINLGASIVIYGLVALFSHRIVLFGETYSALGAFKSPGLPEGTKLPYFPFLLRYGAVTLGLFIAMIVLVLAMLASAGSTSEAVVVSVVASAAVLSLLGLGAALAKWGTVFPAIVAGGDTSLKAAAARSEGRVWSTFANLATGPFVIAIAATALYSTIYFSVSGAPARFMADVMGCLLGLVPTHMTAVILSKLYQESEGSAAN